MVVALRPLRRTCNTPFRDPPTEAAVVAMTDHGRTYVYPCFVQLEISEQIAAELGAAVLAIVSDTPVGRTSSPSKPLYHAPLH